jgi:hypothetical protein
MTGIVNGDNGNISSQSLSRAVAVRSNAFGAYAIAQRECEVTREQIHVGQSSLWDDMLPLSPFTMPVMEELDSIHDWHCKWGQRQHIIPKAALSDMNLFSSHFTLTLCCRCPHLQCQSWKSWTLSSMMTLRMSRLCFPLGKTVPSVHTGKN